MKQLFTTDDTFRCTSPIREEVHGCYAVPRRHGEVARLRPLPLVGKSAVHPQRHVHEAVNRFSLLEALWIDSKSSYPIDGHRLGHNSVGNLYRKYLTRHAQSCP